MSTVSTVMIVDRHDQVQWRGKYARDKWLDAIANRVPAGAEIAIHRDVGLSQRQIAQKLGIHSSTVSRELRRNSRDMNPHKRSDTAIIDAALPGSGQSDSQA